MSLQTENQVTAQVEIPMYNGKRIDAIAPLISRKAQTIFNQQLIKNNEIKRLAVQRAVDKATPKGFGIGNYLIAYRAGVGKLLDSKSYESTCKSLEINPFNVATHVVFDGKTKIDAVLNHGIEKVYGNKVHEMNVEPLFSEDELNSAKIICSSN